MGLVVGYASKLYRVAASTPNEVPNCKDLTYTMEDTQHDATTRQHAGTKAYLQTLRDIGIEFSMNYDTADADYIALRDAYLNKTPIEVYVLDGPINVAGSQGIHATVQIFSFPISQPLDGNNVTDGIKMAPYAGAATAPEWYTASGS